MLVSSSVESFVLNKDEEEEDGSSRLFFPSCIDKEVVRLDGLCWIGRRNQTTALCWCVDGITNPFTEEGSSSTAVIGIEMECIVQFTVGFKWDVLLVRERSSKVRFRQYIHFQQCKKWCFVKCTMKMQSVKKCFQTMQCNSSSISKNMKAHLVISIPNPCITHQQRTSKGPFNIFK